jgi:predicted protein tyrosine phosphatase
MNLAICGLDELKGFIGQATHIISIVDPEDVEFLPRLGVKKGHHLILTCHDVDSSREALQREARMPGSTCVAPTKAMVKQALEFGKQLPRNHFIVINCGYGVSRSPAIAFALLCQARPKKPESDLLQEIIKLRPEASPNALIVKFADELLHRDGRMIRAVQKLSVGF